VASGTWDTIKAVVAKFRRWSPRCEVTVKRSQGGESEDLNAELLQRTPLLAQPPNGVHTPAFILAPGCSLLATAVGGDDILAAVTNDGSRTRQARK
jgi:hypothetical protein